MSEARLDRLERVVHGLVRHGISLRNDVRRQDRLILRIEAALDQLVTSQSETDDKLNGLIDLVDKMIRNGRK